MDVATIVANIKSQSLVGNTGAADDDDRILRYINKGYVRIYTRAIQINSGYFRKFMSMVITDGGGYFPYGVFKVLSVADTGNNSKQLCARTIGDIQETDFGLTATGNPSSYDEVHNGLITYPRNSTTLSVGFVPAPVALTSDTSEINIQLPVAFHETIEWVALKMMAYDERDKLVGAEVQFTESELNGLMEGLIMFLRNKLPANERRVKAW